MNEVHKLNFTMTSDEIPLNLIFWVLWFSFRVFPHPNLLFLSLQLLAHASYYLFCTLFLCFRNSQNESSVANNYTSYITNSHDRATINIAPLNSSNITSTNAISNSNSPSTTIISSSAISSAANLSNNSSSYNNNNNLNNINNNNNNSNSNGNSSGSETTIRVPIWPTTPATNGDFVSLMDKCSDLLSKVQRHVNS